MRWTVNVLRWAARLLVGGGLLVVTGCTMLGLNYASVEIDNKPDARPAITASSLEEWLAGRARLIQSFSDHVYGPWPDGQAVELVSRRMVDDTLSNDTGTLEELEIRVGSGAGARSFHLALALPDTDASVPLIISQSFASNCDGFPGAALTAPDGGDCREYDGIPGIISTIFGEFIALVPFEQYFDHGYGYATWQADDFIPDREGEAQAVMTTMAGDRATAATGTLAGWGYGFSAIIDVLAGDSAIDTDRIAVLGHSRHAKSAMLAAVHDRRIAAVVSHQSGFGGAASSRSETGETVKRLIDGVSLLGVVEWGGFPHWFDPAYATYAGRTGSLPVDQHQLIALIAPIPLLLGNGRRDVWSDPNSTYRMAEAADPVYELYGTEGLDQGGMQDFNPAAPLSYFMRPGGHSVIQRDIDAFIAFLDTAMPPGKVVPDPANPTSVFSQ
jgi:hypothetical protein